MKIQGRKNNELNPNLIFKGLYYSIIFFFLYNNDHSLHELEKKVFMAIQVLRQYRNLLSLTRTIYQDRPNTQVHIP